MLTLKVTLYQQQSLLNNFVYSIALRYTVNKGPFMKKIFSLLFIIFLVNISAVAKEYNLNKLIQQAKKEDKVLYLFLHRVGCSYCNSMEEFTLDDEAVKAELKKDFIFVSINVTYKEKVYYKDYVGDAKSFAQYIGYDIYPTSLFFDDGKLDPIESIVGYYDEAEFIKMLRYIGTRAYKTQSYKEFVKSGKH